jgi:hypothetical protein
MKKGDGGVGRDMGICEWVKKDRRGLVTAAV